jgi:hypothetical protein
MAVLVLALVTLLAGQPGSSTAKIIQEPRESRAREELAKALARAAQKNRRVLLVLFQEWHGPSSALTGVLREDEGLQRELLYEYDLVVANPVLDPDAAQVAREHGLDPDALAKPHVAVLDAQGNVIGQEAGSAFEVVEGDARRPDPAKVLAFLAKHRATPLDAEARLREALVQAERTNRRVLVHFGAPW